MESTPTLSTPSNRFRRLSLEAGLAVPIGLLAGSASALFLWSLDRVTAARWHSPWLLWLLPVVGFAVGWIYLRFGQRAERGTHLIMDEIHAPGGGVPARMAPLVLFGTLATHLCGGSAGREGTALQIGGSLADAFSRLCRIEGSTRRRTRKRSLCFPHFKPKARVRGVGPASSSSPPLPSRADSKAAKSRLCFSSVQPSVTPSPFRWERRSPFLLALA